MKIIGYVIIGAAVGIAAPFVYGTPVNVPVIGYLVQLLIGDADFVSFTPLYFLSYTLSLKRSNMLSLRHLIYSFLTASASDRPLIYRMPYRPG